MVVNLWILIHQQDDLHFNISPQILLIGVNRQNDRRQNVRVVVRSNLAGCVSKSLEHNGSEDGTNTHLVDQSGWGSLR